MARGLAMLTRQLWRDWNRPSDLGLRMTKLGLLLLIASLIGNRVLPKEIESQTSNWLAMGLIDAIDIVRWLVWIVGGGLTLVGAARIFTIDAP
jgi:hypothetical protein